MQHEEYPNGGRGGRVAAYTYIVVGGGSAGAVVASRLSERPEATVLLLEAGPRDRHPLLSMPLAFRPMLRSNAYNWKYESEPEPAMFGRRIDIPRGRTLGGTSSINAMIAIRGNRRDYDRLREQGLEGWGYDDVLPYFRRLENSWRGAGPYHGVDGPVGISSIQRPEMLYEPLRDAAAAVGIPENDDPNGERQEGVCRMEATIAGGRRASTGRAYLRLARGRRNLTVATGAHATRVLLEHGRAVGVEYWQGGRLRQARAEGEVILSGGSYNSPQLLMLSGIGPAAHLREQGVEVRHDLPAVGQNLSEHPNLIIIFRARDRVGLTPHLRYDRAGWLGGRWLARHDGLFATNGGTANIFLHTEPGLDRPDMQLICMAVNNTATLWFPGLTPPPLYGFSARVGPLHPYSRGEVRLRSADPRDKPRVLFNMFADPRDMATMIRGVRMAREIYGAEPMAGMIADEVFPGRGCQTDAELDEAIRRATTLRSHPVGTCRMGADEDSVVDARLRVRGVAGLRVADASVLPEVPSGNTNLPSIMIGEKAADLILDSDRAGA